MEFYIYQMIIRIAITEDSLDGQESGSNLYILTACDQDDFCCFG